MAKFLICNDDDLVRISSITSARRGLKNNVELYAESEYPAGKVTVEKSVPMKQIAEMLNLAENFGNTKVSVTWDEVVKRYALFK